MIIIENVAVYGLKESVIASGYPMMKGDLNYKRAKRLGSSEPGSGHDCFLKGIIVQADITAPQYWWLQWQRYHFHDIISSESKMHGITNMDIAEQCNEYVDLEIIEILKEYIKRFKEDPSQWRFQIVISNCPMGLMLKARITANYLQLKTIWHQRRKHKLEEWQIFCDWIETLPMFKEIVIKSEIV